MWIEDDAVPLYRETMAERFGAGLIVAEEKHCRISITHIQPLVR